MDNASAHHDPPPNPREHKILTSLTATVSTLATIEKTLDDILLMTDPNSADSVYAKQEKVVKSLKRWERMVKKSR